MTPAEQATLKTAILAETDTTFVELRNGGATKAIADWYNQPHPSLRKWSSAAPWAGMQAVIDYSKYTPANANIPTDIAGLCKMVAILIKLTVQQNMLIGMASVNAKDVGTISGVLDTVTGIPAGAASAQVNPGGASGGLVAATMHLPATKAQALFVTSSPVFGGVTASLVSFDSLVQETDVVAALA
jgi:hypothetical protein